MPCAAINYQGPDVDFRFCPFCEGVWLNAGDFKKILDALSEEAESKSVSEYVKVSLKEGIGDFHKSQESYLGMEGSKSRAAHVAASSFY